MKSIIACMLLLATSSFGEVLHLDIKTPQGKIDEILKRINACDVTSGMQMLGEVGKPKPRSFFWEADDYDVVLSIYRFEHEDRLRIDVWRAKGFWDLDKGEMEQKKTSVDSIEFDTVKKTFRIPRPESGANKPPLPTPASDTPAAGAPVAPPSRAAGL
jgi:hypothetical protein